METQRTNDEPASKRVKKLEEIDVKSVNCNLSNISNFKIVNVLSNNAKTKSVSISGEFEGVEGSAVLLLEKTHFCNDDLEKLFCPGTSVKQIFENSIYGKYECEVNPENNLIKMTVIHPATSDHIRKYATKNFRFVEETGEDYEKITKPHILSRKFSLQWVYNILEHKAEKDRIVCEDNDPNTGFILIPDLKWNVKDIEDMHLTCICHDKSLTSIRDLRKCHLSLLKNIQKLCYDAIENKYSVSKHKIRAYFHYQPTYYHLHVHFTHVKFDAPGCQVERAHLLSTVISNIENFPDYYKHATMSYILNEDDSLIEKLTEIS